MQTFASRTVQKNFGAISDRVVREGEVMTITKYGRPSMYLIPANEEMGALMRKVAGRKFMQTLRARKPTAAAAKLTQEDINRLIDECFV